jgi:hypothetical protein
MTKLIILFTLCFNSQIMFGQTSEHDTVKDIKWSYGLKIDEIKSKRFSELAKEITIEEFIQWYFQFGDETYSPKKFGKITTEHAYSDSYFVYIVRRTENFSINFFKIPSQDFDGINLSNLDWELIKNKFINTIIPLEDKVHMDNTCKTYQELSDNRYFEYKYFKDAKIIEIKYRLKLSCGGFTPFEKLYTSNYSIERNSFLN